MIRQLFSFPVGAALVFTCQPFLVGQRVREMELGEGDGNKLVGGGRQVQVEDGKNWCGRTLVNKKNKKLAEQESSSAEEEISSSDHALDCAVQQQTGKSFRLGSNMRRSCPRWWSRWHRSISR